MTEVINKNDSNTKLTCIYCGMDIKAKNCVSIVIEAEELMCSECAFVGAILVVKEGYSNAALDYDLIGKLVKEKHYKEKKHQ